MEGDDGEELPRPHFLRAVQVVCRTQEEGIVLHFEAPHHGGVDQVLALPEVLPLVRDVLDDVANKTTQPLGKLVVAWLVVGAEAAAEDF